MKDGLKFAGIVASVIILVLVLFVLKFGVNPRPIGVLDPSNFDNPTEMGRGLYKAMWKHLQQRDVLVVGFDQKDLELKEVWSGFLAAHQEDSTSPVKRVSLEAFSEKWPSVPTWFVVEDYVGFHGGKEPPIKLAEDKWKRFVTTLILSRGRSAEADCGLEIGSVESYRNLECLRILGSRQIRLNKRVDSSRYRALMNQPGTADLVFIYLSPETTK